MAKGNENANPRSGGESDFEVETIIGRLDKMHYVFLKEVDEIKHSVVSVMAKQRAEFELEIQRKDEQLITAEKEIEDLNKENEQLKRSQLHLEKCFRRCSVELKRMPLSEIQQEKNCARNRAETVSRPQEEQETLSTPKTGQQNELKTSQQGINVQDSRNDFKPITGLTDQHENSSLNYLPPEYQHGSENGNKTCSVESKKQHLSVSSGPEFRSPVVQQLTSDFEASVTTFNSAISSGHSSRHQDIVPEFIDYLPVYKSEDQVFEDDQSSSLELACSSADIFNSSEGIQEQECVEYVPVHGIKVEQLNDEQVFQPANVNTDESLSTQFPPPSIAEQEQTGPVMIESQSEPSAVAFYQCDICQASFNCQNLLWSHRKFHEDFTGLKRYKCTQCMYSSNHLTVLKFHTRTHTNKKPFVCDVCQRVFTRSSHLERHMRTHTKEKPYACEVCERAFTRSSHLQRHMRTHTKEKPYTCEVCERAFSDSSNLRVHIRIHTGVKLYKCSMCHRSFNRKKMLNAHEQSSHKL